MTNETGYWEALEEAKEAALKMAAGLSNRDKRLVCQSLQIQAADEVEHDQTMQRLFERSFLSMDCPNQDGSMSEYSFGDFEVNRMIDEIDEPYNELRREDRRKRRFMIACDALFGHPELQVTLFVICQYETREAIFSILKINAATFRARLSKITKILKSELVI